MDSRYKALLSVLEDRAGEALRVAAIYNADDEYLLYSRKDISTDLLRQRLERIAVRARDRQPLLGAEAVAGPCNADLELYDKYTLMHWFEGPSRGILVTLEPIVARQLNGFVEECNLALQSPQESRYHTPQR